MPCGRALPPVSSTLKPQRFTQITPGVVLWIGGRSGQGEIDQFFADDRRDSTRRRTYIAERAQVSAAGDSYVVELHDGTLQYLEADGRFSEISFSRYDLNVEQLSESSEDGNRRSATDSVTLAVNAVQSGDWTPELTLYLVDRGAEGLRVLGICLVVLAIAAFPSGRRVRIQLPLEAVVLLIGFGERGLSAYSPMGASTGAVAMIVVGGGALLWRARSRRIEAVPA
jgi:lipopolysaccharide export system permease protein